MHATPATGKGRWIGLGAASLLSTGAIAYPPLSTGLTFSTGSQTSAGIAAPAGMLWSEVPPLAGIAQGHLADGNAGASVAEDFVVIDPEGWTLSEAVVYAYQPGASAQDQPFTGASARLWSGMPGAAGSTVLWTSAANCLAGSVFSGVYRADSRGLTTRPVFELHLAVNASLAPGTYWLEWSGTGSGGAGVWAPAIGGASSNAVQSVGGVWAPVGDAPIGAGPLVPQSLPMSLRGWVQGSSPGCYANCDGSTGLSFVNAQDFGCFLRRYALGSPYANCDGSAAAPVLNVGDFTCYLQQFAAGCSAP